jgi:chitin disaccharide deacetylase
MHQAGVLSSATLMARAPATDEAIEIARATSSLGVGCHIVLVDGDPMLPPTQLPTLADSRTSRLHPTLNAFLQRVLTGKIRAQDIEIEARAQIQFLQSRGVTLTHIDTHKHTHMFPRVLHPVLRAARSCGIHAIRNPFEPAWSINATPGAPFPRRTQVRLLRLLASTFHRIVAEEGFVTTRGALGVLATGTLDAPTITSLLKAIPTNKPNSIYELVTHPAYNDAALAAANTRLLTSRETERTALAVLREFPNFNLVNFTNLT